MYQLSKTQTLLFVAVVLATCILFGVFYCQIPCAQNPTTPEPPTMASEPIKPEPATVTLGKGNKLPVAILDTSNEIPEEE